MLEDGVWNVGSYGRALQYTDHSKFWASEVEYCKLPPVTKMAYISERSADFLRTKMANVSPRATEPCRNRPELNLDHKHIPALYLQLKQYMRGLSS